jgi:hypothetical protein
VKLQGDNPLYYLPTTSFDMKQVGGWLNLLCCLFSMFYKSNYLILFYVQMKRKLNLIL